MADIPGIDLERVTAWLAAQVPECEGPLRFERIIGGHSNLTYHVVSERTGKQVVLRRPPLGHLLPSAHDMTREYRLIAGLGPTAVPVPPALGLCEDADVIGAPFYVMGFVEGPVLHDRAAAEDAFADKATRHRLGSHFIDVLADMHAVDPDDVGLGDLGRKEGYIARQLKRWYGQYQASNADTGVGTARVDEMHDWLAANVPDQGPARVVHGDYRLGNCISGPPGEIRAVLDWEIATLGDPLADLGYVMATWPEPDEEPLDPRATPGPTMAGGFPTRDELVDRYAKRSGRDVSMVDYYTAFSYWKGACIVSGVHARYVAGALDTTGVDLDGFGRSVALRAEEAYEASLRLR